MELELCFKVTQNTFTFSPFALWLMVDPNTRPALLSPVPAVEINIWHWTSPPLSLPPLPASSDNKTTARSELLNTRHTNSNQHQQHRQVRSNITSDTINTFILTTIYKNTLNTSQDKLHQHTTNTTIDGITWPSVWCEWSNWVAEPAHIYYWLSIVSHLTPSSHGLNGKTPTLSSPSTHL